MEALIFHRGAFAVLSCCSCTTAPRSSSTPVRRPLTSTMYARQPKPCPLICRARKKSSTDLSLETPPEELDDGDDNFGVDYIDDDNDILEDVDVNFEDEFEVENEELYVGDGAGGGGISLSGTGWDNLALALAEEVSLSFAGELKIYAFKTSATSIQVRIENMSNKSGSPSMNDIEAFTRSYQSKLDEAVNTGSLPDNLSLEVSSPGVERVVRIPKDLERFKGRPMYVKYVGEDESAGSPTRECEGIFNLVSFDPESAYCIWGVADVRANREKAGKGRPLSKKQKEWRLRTAFKSLRIVRIYSEC